MSAQIIFWKKKVALLKYMKEFERSYVFYFINWTSLTDFLHYEQTILAIISPTIIVIAVQPLVMSDSLQPHALPQAAGFLVLHYLPDFAQTPVYWVSDALQPSSPLSSSSFPALNLSQHQGSFQSVSSSPQKAKYWQNFRYIATNQTKVIKHMQNPFRPH